MTRAYTVVHNKYSGVVDNSFNFDGGSMVAAYNSRNGRDMHAIQRSVSMRRNALTT